MIVAARPTPAAGAPPQELVSLPASGFGDPDEAISAVLSLVRRLLNVDTAVVARIQNEAWCATHVDDGAFGLQPGTVLPLRDTYCTHIVGSVKPLCIPDAPRHPVGRTVPATAHFGIGAFLGVPLLRGDGTVHGTLCALNRGVCALDDADVALLETLARLIAHELDREELLARERERAAVDYRRLFELANDAILVFDPVDEVILVANARACELYGFAREKLVGRSLRTLSAAADRSSPHLRRLLTEGHCEGFETVQYRADGTLLRLSINASLVEYEGRMAVLSLNRDVTERVASEVALRASEGWFRSLVQNSSDVITVYAADGTLRYASPALRTVLDHDPDDVGGKSILFMAHPTDAPRLRQTFGRLLVAPDVPRRIEFRALHRDGSCRTLEATAVNLLNDPSVGGIVVNARDVTERKAFEVRLEHDATHDPLTDLPNRTYFRERLAATLATTHGGGVAVLYLDLDGFKHVNDSLGHPVGDELLVAAAARLAAQLGPGDLLARFGGDEFTVLAPIADEGEAMERAARLLAALGDPIAVAGREITVGASIGIALGPRHGVDPDDLVRAADAALYRAKAAGRGMAAVFDPAMTAAAHERLTLEADLRRGLDRGEFELAYQPIVDLATGSVRGYEALVRWRHPERGMMLPAAFIPLSEEIGLVVPLGRWVIEEACRQAAAWGNDDGSGPSISVNLSVWQLMDPDLVQTVTAALAATSLSPSRLKLEITESAAMADLEAGVAVLSELKSMGVRLAIDDFGTGYSGLAVLRRYPVDTLKVDRAFVAGVDHDAETAAVVRAIVAMARALDMETTAEGIETEAQATALRALGCDQGQGYLFSRPLPATEAGALLVGRRPADVTEASG